MRLNVDRIRQKEKPSGAAIGRIVNRLKQSDSIQDLDLTGITRAICSGQTITAGELHGTTAADWKSQELFIFDFDNDSVTMPKITPVEAHSVFANHGFPVVFSYHTFSSMPEHEKFRVAIMCDEVVTEPTEATRIITGIMSLFPTAQEPDPKTGKIRTVAQVDLSCTNLDRIFFGTDKGLIGDVIQETFRKSAALSLYCEPESEELTLPPQPRPLVHDTLDLAAAYDSYDLRGYILSTTSSGIARERGHETLLNPCPICGHRDDCWINTKKNTYKCHSASNGSGGNILNYLMEKHGLDRNVARDMFKYELLGIDKDAEQQEWKERAKINSLVQRIITPAMPSKLTDKLLEMQPHSSYTFDDKGLGELFADTHCDLCRYNATAKEWFVYNGKNWQIDTGAMVVSRYAKDLADALLVYAISIPDEKQKRAYIDFVNRLGQLRARDIMIKDARDKYYVNTPDFDRDLFLFNCKNGTFNLRTFEFTEHRASDLLSKISNVVYDPEADSAEFETFIENVMQGVQEKIDYLQRVLGHTLTGDTSLETAFFLYGPSTRNGKSTLVETYAYMLGNSTGYALTMRPETLAQKQNMDSRQASGDIARLNGCRFLNAAEPPKRMIIDVGLLKNLLGRDSITARHLHEREFEFVPCFKLFLNTNFLPLITDDTLFSSGRINVISFDRHFEPHEQDLQLKNKLKEQKNISGLFNWCLVGLQKFYESGARPPAAVQAATAEYQANSDKVGNFLAECMEPSFRNSKAKDVYEAYASWCRSNGYGAENKTNFFAELKSKGIYAPSGTINGSTVKNIIKGYELIHQNPVWTDVSDSREPLPF